MDRNHGGRNSSLVPFYSVMRNKPILKKSVFMSTLLNHGMIRLLHVYPWSDWILISKGLVVAEARNCMYPSFAIFLQWLMEKWNYPFRKEGQLFHSSLEFLQTAKHDLMTQTDNSNAHSIGQRRVNSLWEIYISLIQALILRATGTRRKPCCSFLPIPTPPLAVLLFLSILSHT